MKKTIIVICFILFVAPCVAMATDNSRTLTIDATLLDKYYSKAKKAYERQEWLEAIKLFSIYRWLNEQSNANEDVLEKVDDNIATARDRLLDEKCGSGTSRVRDGGGF